MKSERVLRSSLLFIPCLVLGLVLFSTAFGSDQTEGQNLFMGKGCNYCHAVPDSGIEATTSIEPLKSNLVGLSQRFEKTWLENYLRKKTDLNGEPHRKAFKGPDQELRTIIDWLFEQEGNSNVQDAEKHALR